MIDAPPPMSEPSPTTTPGRDPALHHGGAERAGVEVDEALVHDRGAGGEVRAEPDPVGVGDPDAGRHHVVDHPGELVDPVDGQHAGRRPRTRARSSSTRSGGHGPGRGPGDVGQQRRRCRRGWPGGAGPGGGRAGAAAGTRRRVRRRVGQRVDRRSPPRWSAGRAAAGRRPPPGAARAAPGRPSPAAPAAVPRPSLPVGYQASSTWPVGGDGGQAEAPGGRVQSCHE